MVPYLICLTVSRRFYPPSHPCPRAQCMDSDALNYDESATIAAACTPRVVGCTNPAAENYHEGANVDVGCLYAGCTDSTRPNFDATATIDSGECAAIFLGCTDATALNFHPAFNVDDGSCRVLGCTDSADVAFHPSAVVDGGCATVAGARRRLDGSNTTAGCIDPIAANFDSSAVTNDGSCAYSIQGCADSTALNYLSATTSPIPASCDYPVRGCTAPTALNFDSNARVLDSSCVFAKPGCTDTAASTYTLGANVDDGRCVAHLTSQRSLRLHSAAHILTTVALIAVAADTTYWGVRSSTRSTTTPWRLSRRAACRELSAVSIRRPVTLHRITTCPWKRSSRPSTMRVSCVPCENRT